MTSQGGTSSRPPREIVRRAAVLGAGTMGSQIAAILANQGIPCDLLDLVDESGPSRSRLAEQGLQRLSQLAPPPLYGKEALNLIRPGNLTDHLERIREADWVVEAVLERLDIKHTLWGQVAPFVRPDAIASSNTSGIPIAAIVEPLPEALRRQFVGTHFFNPPRYLRLLEVTPTAETDTQVTADIARFAEHVLGKGIVIANDVPNFIANRIGCYGYTLTLRLMEELGLGPDEVDSITGPAIGRPNSATFRTLDLVGLDIFIDVCDNMLGFVKEEWERSAYEVPAWIREMSKRGWIGDKGGQGFYKRTREGGATQILALDPHTMEYHPRRRAQASSLAAIGNVEDVGQRFRTLVNTDDDAGRFAWRLMSDVMVYSARKVGEVADDISAIDRAMGWGFGWELGPFESWDALGVPETVDRMTADGLEVPGWIVEAAQRGESFYRHEPTKSFHLMPTAGYTPVPAGDRSISLRRLRVPKNRIAERPGASLYDLGDGVAFLDFHSPKQAIGYDFLDMLDEAARVVPKDFQGLVVSSHVQPNFCVGANVSLILDPAKEGKWEDIHDLIRRFQGGLLQLKRLPVPVVVATYGAALGGGAEIGLAADRVVAVSESAIGLVEIGAGLIPAGGGCKELLVRAWHQVSNNGSRADQESWAKAVGRVFETIGLSKTSGSAKEAQSLGFLRSSDVVVPNLDHLLYEAKVAVQGLASDGYTPPGPQRVPVAGETVRVALEESVQKMVAAGQATEHDQAIAHRLAFVLTGGGRPVGTEIDEEQILNLEREALVALCGERKSRDRMQHILDTGRPLRN